MLTLGNLDITDALAHSRYNIQYLFDKLPLGTVVTDDQGVIVYYNQVQSQIDGLEPDFAVGKTGPEIYDYLNFPDLAKICLTCGRPILGLLWLYRTIFGKTIDAANWIYPLFKGPKVIGAIRFIQPLTFRRSESAQCQPREGSLGVPCARDEKKILGGNLQFQRAIQIALAASAGPSPVLITGETGTGKEMFARLIHESSFRKEKPFIAINCAALPTNLMEGLLFGTARGSFTGATDRPGLFEEANGGVLYLDEIASMPMELQPKLLRILQEMQVRRIGSNTEKKLNIKLISSLGATVDQILKTNCLRQDLFYRLAVVVLELPALRDRLDDLDELSNHFCNKYSQQLNKKCNTISPALRTRMHSYNWPGNVRELEHFVAGIINMARPNDKVLGIQHLPMHYRHIFEKPESDIGLAGEAGVIVDNGRTGVDLIGDLSRFRASGLDVSDLPQAGLSLKSRLGQDELAILVKALSKSRGNVANAARELCISRQLLNYKMSKYGLARKQFLS